MQLGEPASRAIVDAVRLVQGVADMRSRFS
jgi:hypothetical protein